MKAIVWTNYGPPDVLQLREVAKPAPKDNEALIKVHATTVLAGDRELRSSKFSPLYWLLLRMILGVFKPTRVTILGQELAGEIEAVGKNVTHFKAGDPVFAATGLRLGTYAEYVCLPEAYLVLKPADMTYEEAATLPTGGIYGLHLLRQGNVRAGQRVLIIGAGGSIGTFAVQIARAWGASVTGVDSAGKLDMLRSIGVERAIDYAQGDYTRSGETYDVIIDVLGKGSFSGCIRSLKPDGIFVLGNPGFFAMLRGRWISMTGGNGKRVVFESAAHSTEYYHSLVELFEAGKIKPVIDRRYPLEQTAEAHRYVDSGQKTGSVVITVGQDPQA